MKLNPLLYLERAQAAHPRAVKLATWLIAQGYSPRESVDVLLYAVGYIATLKDIDLDPVDFLGMIAGGNADAILDRTAFEKESKQ